MEEVQVLIESDWNLKLKKGKLLCVRKASINRIRLEFKDALAKAKSYSDTMY